jgi:hypothetical protein
MNEIRPKPAVTYVSENDFFMFLCRFDTTILAAQLHESRQRTGATTPRQHRQKDKQPVSVCERECGKNRCVCERVAITGEQPLQKIEPWNKKQKPNKEDIKKAQQEIQKGPKTKY